MRFAENTRTSIPLSFIVLGNLIPAYGALFLGWDVFLIFFLYWLENVVIGIFTLCQMLLYGAREGLFGLLPAVFMGAFFTVHYGMFTMGHGVFVFAMFGQAYMNEDFSPEALLNETLLILQHNHLILAFAGLVLAQLFQAVQDFTNPNRNAAIVMFSPYGRIIVLHIALILGGGLALAIGAPFWALVVLIVLKTVFEILHYQGRKFLGFRANKHVAQNTN